MNRNKAVLIICLALCGAGLMAAAPSFGELSAIGINTPRDRAVGIDKEEVNAYLQVGNESTDSFTLTNSGSQPITYSISMEELLSPGGSSLPAAPEDGKNIAGSTLVLNASNYLPGTTVNWTFTVTNASTDSEWLTDVIITFPAGVTVNSATNFTGGNGGDMTPNVTSGNGVTINWHGETSSGWGVIYGNGDSATATVNVTIDSVFSGDLSLPYTINGDVYGSAPHTLSGNIVLPQDIPPIEWLSVLPLSGTIAAGQNQTFTAYFSAVGMAVGAYQAMITVNTTDQQNPSLEVLANMIVWDTGNHVPAIDLPAGFAFDRNTSLDVDFSSYVSDADLDPLTLSSSGNDNVLVAINGLSVTFSAALNWTGSETITFSVYDGANYNYDSVVVSVNEIEGPGWVPVLYPNNSATVYGTVHINGLPAGLNDMVGAFVGGECRGVAAVVMDSGNAYVTIVANLASNGETLSFKIFDYSGDAIYDADQTYSLNYGQVYGTNSSPRPISTNAALGTPVISAISRISGGFRIAWNAVAGADAYEVWRAVDPFGEYEQVGFDITGLLYNDMTELPLAFYYVKAVRF